MPLKKMMQAGVSGMGGGADNLVASMHAMSIGVGEVIGPVLGGFMVEQLPGTPVRCPSIVVPLGPVVLYCVLLMTRTTIYFAQSFL